MKSASHRTIIVILTAAAVLAVLPAPSVARGKGTSGASFMKLSAGARASAMGGAFCAVADDVNALEWNPAGLVQAGRPSAMLSHHEWIAGTQHEYAGYLLPLNDTWAAGASVSYLHLSGITERDVSGNATGREFGGTGRVLSLGAARVIGGSMAAGFAVKSIRETVGSHAGDAWALDMGILAAFPGVTAGLSVQNLGTGIAVYRDSYPLPLVVRAGMSRRFSARLTAAFELELPADNDARIRYGAEYRIGEFLMLRGGYALQPEENTGTGVTAGAGVSAGDYGLDYAFLPFGDFGTVHRVSLTIRI